MATAAPNVDKGQLSFSLTLQRKEQELHEVFEGRIGELEVQVAAKVCVRTCGHVSDLNSTTTAHCRGAALNMPNEFGLG
jgi:hypothetical protein